MISALLQYHGGLSRVILMPGLRHPLELRVPLEAGMPRVVASADPIPALPQDLRFRYHGRDPAGALVYRCAGCRYCEDT